MANPSTSLNDKIISLEACESDLVKDELVPPRHPSTQNAFDQTRFTMEIVSARDLINVLLTVIGTRLVRMSSS
jgi:hypothetical protein